jgi:hypothetical protein
LNTIKTSQLRNPINTPHPVKRCGDLGAKTENKMKTLNQLAEEGNRFAVVKIDETKYWAESVINKVMGEIYGVYLVDLTAPTHLCSIEISYPATNLKNFVPEPGTLGEDELFETEQSPENLREDYVYFTGTSALEVVKLYGADKYPEESFEEMEEYEMCNPSVC